MKDKIKALLLQWMRDGGWTDYSNTLVTCKVITDHFQVAENVYDLVDLFDTYEQALEEIKNEYEPDCQTVYTLPKEGDE